MFLKVLARACFTGILGGRGGKGRGAKETSETPEFWQEASVADESSIWITEEGVKGSFCRFYAGLCRGVGLGLGSGGN